jgi:hypothetical protein
VPNRPEDINKALRARIASLETEARILRERRKEADTNSEVFKRATRQSAHKLERLNYRLEERTLRVRCLERACKLGLGNLRRQDAVGVYWCRTDQLFEDHLAGTKSPGCRYCHTYKQVTEAIAGHDIDDDYTPSVSGVFPSRPEG